MSITVVNLYINLNPSKHLWESLERRVSALRLHHQNCSVTICILTLMNEEKTKAWGVWHWHNDSQGLCCVFCTHLSQTRFLTNKLTPHPLLNGRRLVQLRPGRWGVALQSSLCNRRWFPEKAGMTSWSVNIRQCITVKETVYSEGHDPHMWLTYLKMDIWPLCLLEC